ncbi:uncharacterized protein EV420DRAFT_1645666 [Desarmillaria tabescens]|uniref:Uncharacterized protein n=1 Tax=Armillaria tabescens TaxID=1929756 RepID=A0AA39K1S9_ARMTA|nr:uncharacterized protein EV420DRAFT_1645666 [Desarmillaria tabescens]KAK0452813.1 hypothetical protein EV420DRAFT_1645666 [Desarmillaria tabescens]
MDKFSMDLYRSSCQCFLSKVIPSQHVNFKRNGTFTFKGDDVLSEEHECIIFRKLEPGMSVVMHLLRPEYHQKGWFKVTNKAAEGIASILFDTQVRVLQDIIQQEKDINSRHVRWLTGEKDNDILVYVDFDTIELYSCIGKEMAQLYHGDFNTPELLMQQIANQVVVLTLGLVRLSNIVPKIEGFIAHVICIEIHEVEL